MWPGGTNGANDLKPLYREPEGCQRGRESLGEAHAPAEVPSSVLEGLLYPNRLAISICAVSSLVQSDEPAGIGKIQTFGSSHVAFIARPGVQNQRAARRLPSTMSASE